MKKLLFIITTYNELQYTKPLVEQLKNLKLNSPELEENIEIDILVIDDYSIDETIKWCEQNDVSIIKKTKGMGLTHSWNMGYRYFSNSEEYDYCIISNNDVLVPKGAIKEMVEVFEKWPFSLVVPMSSVDGAGHNGNIQGIEIVWAGTPSDLANDPNSYQSLQNQILEYKQIIRDKNNLYMLDPVRMKMFNGFFFMMNRNVIKYEREDGLLFDPEKIMYQGEDEFNWATLIPNNDFSALCKTAFIFHYKGMSTKNKGYSQVRNNIEDWKKLRNKGEQLWRNSHKS